MEKELNEMQKREQEKKAISDYIVKEYSWMDSSYDIRHIETLYSIALNETDNCPTPNRFMTVCVVPPYEVFMDGLENVASKVLGTHKSREELEDMYGISSEDYFDIESWVKDQLSTDFFGDLASSIDKPNYEITYRIAKENSYEDMEEMFVGRIMDSVFKFFKECEFVGPVTEDYILEHFEERIVSEIASVYPYPTLDELDEMYGIIDPSEYGEEDHESYNY